MFNVQLDTKYVISETLDDCEGTCTQTFGMGYPNRQTRKSPQNQYNYRPISDYIWWRLFSFRDLRG